MSQTRRIGSTRRLQRIAVALLLLTAMLAQAVPVFAVAPAISGTIRDSSTALPLAGVTVELWDYMSPDPEPIATATTNASGFYALLTVPVSDTYVLFFEKTGYAGGGVYDFPYSGTPLVKNADLVPLTPIANGTVTDSGTGLAIQAAMIDAWVLIEVESSYEWAGSALSDAAGAYVVYDESGYGAGSYGLSASHQSHLSAANNFTWNGSTPVVKNFALASATRVAYGIVTAAETGDPVNGALVDALRWSVDTYEWAGTGTSDASGAYSTYDTQAQGAGEYQLAAMADVYAAAYEYPNWDGSTAIEQDFALVMPAAIATGTVTESGTGDPIEGASVDAERYDAINGVYDWAGTGFTDVDGAYEVRDEFALGAGDYQLQAASEGHTSQTAGITWGGATTVLRDFVLEPSPAIASGTVTDIDSGAPIAGAWVDASWYNDVDDWYEYTGSAMTASDGVYTVRDDYGYGAGAYEFMVYAQGYHQDSVNDTWDGLLGLEVDFALSGQAIAVPVEGATRFKTAVEASKLAFPEDGSCTTAIVASGRNFPDALGGAALAGAMYGPVLLTEPTALPAEVSAEIARLGVTDVIVVGGTAAVSAPVKDAIDRLPGVSVSRINGVTRYDTAALIAQRTVDELGPGYSGQVFIATGTNFPDALAGAPLAAAAGTPILLVGKDAIPAATSDALESIAPDTAIVLGGTGAVSTAVETQLGSIPGVGSVERIDGASRYETAANIAQWGIDNYGLSWDGVAFATGTNFPDALAGGAAQGLYGSVVLLTKPTTLEAAPKAKIEANANDILEVRFFGGMKAISQAVRDAVMNAIADNKGV